VQICVANVDGVTYFDEIEGRNITRTLTPQFTAYLRSKYDENTAVAQAINPQYRAPKLKKSGGCFVITATTGDANHPRVLILQHFRDEILANWRFGRTFISWYNQHGPAVAAAIEGRRLARFMSYYVVVVPASAVAALLTRLVDREPR
jgi:hypothetical protein